MIAVPDFLTLEAYNFDLPKRSKKFPLGDAFYLYVDWPHGQWRQFSLPESAEFNSIPEALADWKEKYLKAKNEYLATGGENFIDPEFRVHSIYA